MRDATFRALLAALVSLGMVAACVTNPATGRRQLILIGEERAIELGAQADPEIRAEYGVYGDEPLAGWFEGVSSKLAEVSERSHLPYRFAILDSPIVNAFALPGGPVYATRGLLAHANSEAEVAAVMGHEIGHVNARHGVEKLSQQQLLGGVLGAASLVVGERWSGLVDAAGLGAQALLLQYSRDAEREADELGIRYMTRAGYDPRGMPRFMSILDRLSARADGALPTWLSTHPDPGERAETTREMARPIVETARSEGRSLIVKRDEYLGRLGGLVYGDDPRKGFTRGRVFHHPDLRFRLDAPEAWTVINTNASVIFTDDPEEPSAVLELSLADTEDEASPSPVDHVAQLERTTQGVAFEGRSLSVNGLDAWLGEISVRDAASGRTRRFLGSFIAHEGRLYRLLGQWAGARADTLRPALERSMRSFQRERNPEVLGVKPVVLELSQLPAGRALDAWCAARESLAAPCEELALINQISEEGRLEETRRVKVPVRQSSIYP
jgi:predicted Zn-dependent protease